MSSDNDSITYEVVDDEPSTNADERSSTTESQHSQSDEYMEDLSQGTNETSLNESAVTQPASDATAFDSLQAEIDEQVDISSDSDVDEDYVSSWFRSRSLADIYLDSMSDDRSDVSSLHGFETTEEERAELARLMAADAAANAARGAAPAAALAAAPAAASAPAAVSATAAASAPIASAAPAAAPARVNPTHSATRANVGTAHSSASVNLFLDRLLHEDRRDNPPRRTFQILPSSSIIGGLSDRELNRRVSAILRNTQASAALNRNGLSTADNTESETAMSVYQLVGHVPTEVCRLINRDELNELLDLSHSRPSRLESPQMGATVTQQGRYARQAATSAATITTTTTTTTTTTMATPPAPANILRATRSSRRLRSRARNINMRDSATSVDSDLNDLPRNASHSSSVRSARRTTRSRTPAGTPTQPPGRTRNASAASRRASPRALTTTVTTTTTQTITPAGDNAELRLPPMSATAGTVRAATPAAAAPTTNTTTSSSTSSSSSSLPPTASAQGVTPPTPPNSFASSDMSVHNAVRVTVENQTFDFNCSICLEPYLLRIPTIVECGHIFCKICILRHVVFGGHNRYVCPLCLSPLNPSKFQRVYF